MLNAGKLIAVSNNRALLPLKPYVITGDNAMKVDREVRWHEFLYHSRNFDMTITDDNGRDTYKNDAGTIQLWQV